MTTPQSFPVTAGTTYYFCGFSTMDTGGNFRLALSLDSNSDISALNFQYPATTTNDAFADRIPLTGEHVSAMGYSAEATPDVGGPDAGNRTLWWNWTAPASGRVRISMVGSSFPAPALSAFTGTVLTSLKWVALDSSKLTSSQYNAEINFPVSAGSTYQICVGHTVEAAYGALVLSIDLDTSSPVAGLNLPVPSNGWNDQFADQISLTGEDVSAIGYNGSATTQAGSIEPNNGYRTLWWNWTAPKTGRLNIATDQSDDFTRNVSVFLGDSFSALKWVHSGSNSISLPVVAGQVYRISVGSPSSSRGGSIVLTCRLDASVAPAGLNVQGQGTASNDMFANRIPLTGGDVSAVGYPYSATRDVGEPSATSYQTLWWSWTSPGSGRVYLGLSNPDGVARYLSVWTGNSVAALTKVTVSVGNTVPEPTVDFMAQAGVTYQIAVGTRRSDDQALPVVLSLTAPWASPLNLVLGGTAAAPKLTLKGPSGSVVQVEQSNDLKTWTLLQEVTVSGEGAEVTPPAPAPSRPRMFFRARLP